MDQPSPPRRSSWRFSLRELLLLMLAIAAFLGWGRAIYQRYKPFVPTPFANKLDLKAHIQETLALLGEPPGVRGSTGYSRSPEWRRYEQDTRYSFTLRATTADEFMEELRQRVNKQLEASGCTVQVAARGQSGDMDEFSLRYYRDVVEGSIRVILIADGEDARLLVFVDEQRLP